MECFHLSFTQFLFPDVVVQSVMSDSWPPHELQHARLPCPPLTPRADSNPCALSRWCHPTRVFSNESVLCIRWQKYWSFSFSISPSNKYSGLISFRIDSLGLLAIQGILKSLQHYSSKASILWHSAFFIVQLSHPYMTTGKTIIPLFYSHIKSQIINHKDTFHW